MKNKFLNPIGLMILITLSGSQANDSPQIRWGGSARIRYEYDYFNNYQNLRQMTFMRFRPFFEVEPEASLKVYLEPQFAKAMGENTVSANSTSGSAEQNSGLTSDPSLGVHQAYMNYSENQSFQLRVGRQALSYGDELVIGSLEWNNIARSFDGIRIRNENEFTKSDIFWSKLVDTNITSSTSGDYDFFGSYNSFKKIQTIDEVDLYLLYLSDTRGTGPKPLQLWTAGVRLKSKLEALDYRFEVTQQFGHLLGSTQNTHGTQGDLEFGYRFNAENYPIRLGIEGFYADTEYNQLFPTAHKWLGILDAFSRRNISGVKLQTTTSLSEKTKIMLDYHRFYRTNGNDSAYRLNGTALTGMNSTEKLLGSEIDLVTQHELNVKTSLQIGAAALFAADSLKSISDKNPFFGFASWETKF